MQPIFTQTVGAGGASSINFNNIPQTFTDLKLEICARDSFASVAPDVTFTLNGSSVANYSTTRLYGTGSATASDRAAGANATLGYWGMLPGSSATASVFGNAEIYISNYTSANYKSIICDAVTENNATAAFQDLYANLWRNTAAITSISFFPGGSSFTQYSTFTLYGITKG